MRARNAWFLLLLGASLLSLGCGPAGAGRGGGGDSSPTSAGAIPDYRASIPAAPIVPDDPYFKMLTREGDGGRVIRQDPASLMRHCFLAGVPEAVAQAYVDRMTAITGVGQRTGGECSTRWSIDPSLGPKLQGSTGYRVIDNKIGPADIKFANEYYVTAAGLHELGHAMGLQHSNRVTDLMYPDNNRTVSDFSPDEIRVLRWMYGR